MGDVAAERRTASRTRTTPRANLGNLVASVVAGQVANQLVRGSPYRVGRDGKLHVLPGTGGITLNRRVGDRAVGIAGDHVEPGVSLHNNDHEIIGPKGAPNRGLMLFACIGNHARVVTGPATGGRGTVVGKHGGIDHVIVDFPPEVLTKMRIGDRVQITSCGQGLRLVDHPQVRALNLAPRLLRRWGVTIHGEHVHVPVTHIVPAGIMGSGLGKSYGVLGDCDIQLTDPEVVRAHRLGSIRFGDLVAVAPLDNMHGPTIRPGVITIGVIVHSNSYVAGHGPGMTPLLVGPARILRPVFSEGANVAHVLGLRRPSQIAPAVAPSSRELSAIWRTAGMCGPSGCGPVTRRAH